MSRMGWTGLFGSKPPRLKPDPRVRWFGKLPTYADYYTSRNDEDWTVEFNTWVLEGFETYLNLARRQQTTTGSKLPHGIPRLPLAAGAIRMPESNVTVLASFHDYGGDMVGRPFPLCFYVAVPTAQWPGPTSNNVAGCIRALGDLISMRDQVNRHFSAPGGFESRFSSLEIDLSGVEGDQSDTAWRTAAAALPTSDWFGSTRSAAEGSDLQHWAAAVRRRGRQIAALESVDFKPTIALPLAPDVGLQVQVAGWLQWLEARMDLARRNLSLLIVADAAGHPQRMVVIARELGVEDFLLITPLSEQLRYVDDLSKADAAESENVDDSSPDEIPATWGDFVCSDKAGGGPAGGRP